MDKRQAVIYQLRQLGYTHQQIAMLWNNAIGRVAGVYGPTISTERVRHIDAATNRELRRLGKLFAYGRRYAD